MLGAFCALGLVVHVPQHLVRRTNPFTWSCRIRRLQKRPQSVVFGPDPRSLKHWHWEINCRLEVVLQRDVFAASPECHRNEVCSHPAFCV